MEVYETNLLGALTKEELREIYDRYPIEGRIREWIRESDSNFVSEQMDELRGVIDFHVDAWCNVSAWPAISPEDCGMMAERVRNSIFSYPSTMEDALCKLERYSEGVERLGYYDVPLHFEKAIEKQMRVICREYEKCFKAEYDWWMDATSDELFDGYFLDCPNDWMEQCDELTSDFETLTVAKQRVFVEENVMYGGRYDAVRKEGWSGPFWQVRLLPDEPTGKARIVAQRGTRNEAFDLLWQLVMGYNAPWARAELDVA